MYKISNSQLELEIKAIESGTGMGISAMDAIGENLGARKDWSLGKSVAGSLEEDYEEFHSAIEAGKNFRHTALAFALTIPKDMIP